MSKPRNGHAPGHVRNTFLAAVDAFMAWNDGPEPTVEHEIHYEPHQIPISRACGLVWNCTDIIPGFAFQQLRDDARLDVKRRTYAACARAMRSHIQP
jgi:hypothetical protein